MVGDSDVVAVGVVVAWEDGCRRDTKEDTDEVRHVAVVENFQKEASSILIRVGTRRNVEDIRTLLVVPVGNMEIGMLLVVPRIVQKDLEGETVRGALESSAFRHAIHVCYYGH